MSLDVTKLNQAMEWLRGQMSVYEYADLLLFHVESLLAENERLKDICIEVGCGDPKMEDERLSYVAVQIDRATWEDCRAFARAAIGETKEVGDE